MPKNFAESYLIGLLERNLLLEPIHDMEVSRGIQIALGECERSGNCNPLERLAEAVEKTGTGEAMATVNLLNMPLGSLWVRSGLQKAKEKLEGLPKAQVVIIGLWQVLKGRAGRRTEKTEARFLEWKNFVEEQLMGACVGELTVIWVG